MRKYKIFSSRYICWKITLYASLFLVIILIPAYQLYLLITNKEIDESNSSKCGKLYIYSEGAETKKKRYQVNLKRKIPRLTMQ